MENHPIPQDVTGFQFKLIGSMTLKQFAYVGAGVILAVILYYLPLNPVIGTFLKIIFIPLLGGSGFFIAFLPIEGRPVDIMAANFLKALFSPNQFVYHKTGRLLNFASTPSPRTTPIKTLPTNAYQDKNKQLRAMIQTSHVPSQNKLDEREKIFLASLSNISAPAGTPQLQTVPNIQTSSVDSLVKQETNLSQQLIEAKQVESSQQNSQISSDAHQKAALLEKQIQTIHAQKQQLEKELLQLQNQLPTQVVKPQIITPVTKIVQPQPATDTANPQPVKRTDLPHVPDVPNVIVGIVKDPRGNVLPNMLVEVKDKAGNPVRAFKTNALGQFASATPLAAGIYTVELEDPKKQNTFSAIQLTADNRILMPIEIVSHDSREELRKQLFN